jgi:hypothetical protein
VENNHQGCKVALERIFDYDDAKRIISTRHSSFRRCGAGGERVYPCVLASRILGGGALRGGMPWWKYISNRFLSFVENALLGAKLSEYHTGYRAFSRRLLERLPIEANSDDFVFDNQVLAQVISLGCAIGEVTCPARYLPEASSINFRRSVRYGLGCLATALLSVWRVRGSLVLLLRERSM